MYTSKFMYTSKCTTTNEVENFIHNSIKKNKILRYTFRDIEDLHTEKYKTLLKEIKEKLNM